MRTTRTLLALAGVALLVTAAGCGGSVGANNTTETTTAAPATGGTNATTTSMNDTTTMSGMNNTTTSGMNNTTTAMNNTTTSGMNTTTMNTTTMNNTTSMESNNTTTAAGGNTSASVTFEAQSSNGTAVTVQSVALPEGGFVVIHAVANGSAGRVLGHSAYLAAGTHENVSVTLGEPLNGTTPLIAMAHQDTNANESYDYPSADGPYTMNGGPVQAKANVTVS